MALDEGLTQGMICGGWGYVSEERIMSSHRERRLVIEEDNSKENFSYVHTKKKKKKIT